MYVFRSYGAQLCSCGVPLRSYSLFDFSLLPLFIFLFYLTDLICRRQLFCVHSGDQKIISLFLKGKYGSFVLVKTSNCSNIVYLMNISSQKYDILTNKITHTWQKRKMTFQGLVLPASSKWKRT
jgi:hypothetical protein